MNFCRTRAKKSTWAEQLEAIGKICHTPIREEHEAVLSAWFHEL